MAKSSTNNPSKPGPGEPAVDAAIAQAQAAVDQLAEHANDRGVRGLDLPELNSLAGSGGGPGLDSLGDVELSVSVELGRTQMLVEDILRLSEGSVVELDKLAGDPVDVFVNQRLVARGEVLVLNDNFCIRVSEIVDDLHETAQEAAAEGA